MPLPAPEAGLAICYEFLWSREAASGQTACEKRRPAVIVVAAKSQNGQTVVVVAAVTHAEPRDSTLAVELPPKVKRHLGLDERRSWVVLDELNEFVWPGLDIYPVPGGGPGQFDYGFIPPALFKRIKDRILAFDDARKRLTLRPER